MKKLLLLPILLLTLTTAHAKIVTIDNLPSSTLKPHLISGSTDNSENSYYAEMMESTKSTGSTTPLVIKTASQSQEQSSSSGTPQPSMEQNEQPKSSQKAPAHKKSPSSKGSAGKDLDSKLKADDNRAGDVKEDGTFYPLKPSSKKSRFSFKEDDLLGKEGSYESSFVKTLTVLFVLLVLVFITVWLFRRLSFGKFSKGSSSGKGIRILERRALSPKTMLYVIEVQGRKTLIAESQLEVKPLLNIDIEKIDPDL